MFLKAWLYGICWKLVDTTFKDYLCDHGNFSYFCMIKGRKRTKLLELFQDEENMFLYGTPSVNRH